MEYSTLLRLILSFFIGILINPIAFSQMPDCNMYYRMVIASNTFETVNPINNTATVNSITLPAGANGLAVNDNFFVSTPSQTYYTTVNGVYHYYNGTTWVNTGHSTGGLAAVNPGGAGPYIYNLIGGTGKVYRYDGTGPSTLFLSLGSFTGPYDVMGDSDGNLYVLRTGAAQVLEMYDVNANLVCSYNILNLTSASAGGGYSIVNGMIYTDAGNTGLYVGTISGNTITFSQNPLSGSYSDFANCPFPPINLSINPPIDLGCSNSSVQLSANTSITNPIYNWTGPGIVSGANTPNPTVNQPGVYTLTVSSSPGSSGCTGTATKEVTVTQTGGLTVDMTASVLTICEGESSTLNITVSGGALPFTYTWNNNLNSSSSNTVSPTSTTTYTCVVSDNNNCSGTVSKTILVDSKPIVNAGNDVHVCIGAEVTLSGSGVDAGGSYTWNNGVSDGIPFTPNAGTTTYTLTGMNASGCENSDQVVVNVNPLPVVNAGPDRIICYGESIKLTAEGGAGTYVWDNGVVNGANFIPDTGSITYTVVITDVNGCQNTDQVNVTVQPNVNVSFTGDPMSGEPPLEVIFTNTSSNGDTYIWDFGNGSGTTVNDLSQQTTSYSQNGTYLVTLTGYAGNCSNQYQATVEVIGTTGYLIPNVFTPNEDNSNDFFTINAHNIKEVYVIIINRWGSVVFESSEVDFKWNGKVNNSGESCSDGVYFYKIKIIDLDGKEVNEHGFVHLIRD